MICSDLAEIREWARDAPIYVQVDDAGALLAAARSLADDPAGRRRMAERGRATGMRWQVAAEVTAAAVETVLTGRQAAEELMTSS